MARPTRVNECRDNVWLVFSNNWIYKLRFHHTQRDYSCQTNQGKMQNLRFNWKESVSFYDTFEQDRAHL